MSSAVKKLRYSVLRSVYRTPPRARPAQLALRPWKRGFSVGVRRMEKGEEEVRLDAGAIAAEDEGKEPGEDGADGEEVAGRGAEETAKVDDATEESMLAHEALKAGTEERGAGSVETADVTERDSVAADHDAPEDGAEAAQEAVFESPEEAADAFAQAIFSAHESGDGEEAMAELDPTLRQEIRAAMGEEGFWKYSAANPKDAAFLKENVTSEGHEELERMREYREYARLAAWELPLLSKLAKPFVPPTKAQPLRFRYSSYLGEAHPAAPKVVVEFCVADLPDLTEAQQTKLIKLLGVRYNPSTNTAKVSCDSFDTQAQNKRFLLDRVAALLKAARDPTDMFEDVPFDFRHHKPKVVHQFPREWILTPERKKMLRERFEDKLLLEKKAAMLQDAAEAQEMQQKREALLLTQRSRPTQSRYR